MARHTRRHQRMTGTDKRCRVRCPETPALSLWLLGSLLLLGLDGWWATRNTKTGKTTTTTAEAVECRDNRCIPGCECTDPDQIVCASEFGTMGWIPPDDAEESVLDEMPPKYEIKYNQLKPTGMRGEANRKTGIGAGIGKILNITNTTMEGEIYFEVDPDIMVQITSGFSKRAVAELYGGIDIGLSPCDEGIVLGKELINMTGVDDRVDNFNYDMVVFDDYNNQRFFETSEDQERERVPVDCHPRSTNGKIGAVRFSLEDPFYYNETSASIMNIWYPLKGSMPIGTLEFCVRLSLFEENNSQTVASFLDTKFKIEVTEPTEENNYTRFTDEFSDVKVYSNQMIGPDEDQLEEEVRGNATEANSTASSGEDEDAVPFLPKLVIEAVLCGSPLESDEVGVYNSLRTFYTGQTFRICVGPSKGYENKYHVLGFDSVVCRSNKKETIIVEEGGGLSSPLTIVENETIGFALANGGSVEYNGVISLDAIVNSDLSSSEEFFECEGIVFVKDLSLEGEAEGDPPEGDGDGNGERQRERQRGLTSARNNTDNGGNDGNNSTTNNPNTGRNPSPLEWIERYLYRVLQDETEPEADVDSRNGEGNRKRQRERQRRLTSARNHTDNGGNDGAISNPNTGRNPSPLQWIERYLYRVLQDETEADETVGGDDGQGEEPEVFYDYLGIFSIKIDRVPKDTLGNKVSRATDKVKQWFSFGSGNNGGDSSGSGAPSSVVQSTPTVLLCCAGFGMLISYWQ